MVSPRHPFLFSCGEDKQVKCWDLEYNKVLFVYSNLKKAKCFFVSVVIIGRDRIYMNVYAMTKKGCEEVFVCSLILMLLYEFSV